MVESKTLFITAFHPGGKGFIGAGEAISEQHLKAILAKGTEIHLISLAPAYQVANPEIVALCKTYTTVVHSRWKTLQALLSPCNKCSIMAPWFFTRVSPKNLQLVLEVVQRYQISKIHLDFPSCLGFAPFFTQLSLQYSIHDVVTQKIERKSLLRYLSGVVSHIESSLLSKIHRCYALSEKDAMKCREIGYTGEIEILAPHNTKIGNVDNGKPIHEVLAQFGIGPNMVFFGNMQREENHKSILRFLFTTYPRIWLNNRRVRFWVLGLAPRISLRVLGRLVPGVQVVGAVDDPTLAFRQATLCIAPIYYGAGVKIKVLQMLDAGATVVSTAIGAEGVPDNERLIIADDDAFTTEVNRLINQQ